MTISEKVSDFQKHLRPTNRSFDYYVNWDNIFYATRAYNIEIHALDSLIHCSNEEFQHIFSRLLFRLPSVVEVFPYLFALSKIERNNVINDGYLTILDNEIESDLFYTYNFNRNNLIKEYAKYRSNNYLYECEDELISVLQPYIDNYYDFFCKMGLKILFENILEKSVMDYITGVLVGMDSNGRKNRGGKSFECACKPIISKLCQNYNLILIEQKQFKYLYDNYGIPVSDDIKNRKCDFIIIDVHTKKAMNIEVNFYNDNGSKPEEIIDSYINRQHELIINDIKFALITDGNCWISATSQLTKGIKKIKNIINFHMLVNGELEKIIKEEFGV